jgi:iron complex transport system ATP-binding protein
VASSAACSDACPLEGPRPTQVSAPDPVITLRGVAVRRDGKALIEDIDFSVGPGERWVVLGPNGAGKTTMLGVAGARVWPSSGEVEILGARLGRVDLRTLRGRVALVSASVVRQLRPAITAREVVVSGRFGALETWWHHYDEEDWARADQLLADVGLGGPGGAGQRAFGLISEGERQQVLLARALMAHPEVLLLDEPFAGLDLGARERLVTTLAALAQDPDTAPVVMVTHHVEEIPPGFTHAALMRAGRLIAAGPLEVVLGAESLSACFGVEVVLDRAEGRWSTRARIGGRQRGN